MMCGKSVRTRFQSIELKKGGGGMKNVSEFDKNKGYRIPLKGGERWRSDIP